jgi:predicted phage terminase large subunit-like protein
LAQQLTTQPIRLRQSTLTLPQSRFWKSNARYRLFAGGAGSGKSYAGCLEILRQPAGSIGMVCAPTYTMLRDSTLTTFLEITRRGGVLKSFNKSDGVATLINNTRVLFRSADEPDRLRGVNLGFFYLDEGALVDEEIWLILLARLRLSPGRAWVTSTPKGFSNWLYTRFAKATSDDYCVIYSSTRDNIFLPAGFVDSLASAYTEQWQQQEIEGLFTELAGTIFHRDWFQILEHLPEGAHDWRRYWDLAASVKTTADYTASSAVALGGDGVLYLRDMIHGKWEWPDAKKIIMQTMLAEPATQHGIEEAMHGLAAIQELRREPSIANITLRGIRVDRDKISRALPWAARAESAKVKLIRGNWNSAFLDQVSSFPHGHDDMIDSVSGGLQMLTKPQRRILCA